MNLAQDLRQLALASKEEIIKMRGEECANFLRNKARAYAKNGLMSFQVDNFFYNWGPEEVEVATNLLREDGFYVVTGVAGIAVSWNRDV